MLELSHKVTRGLRLPDQFLTGAVRPVPCWNVFHTCILAGVRCVGPSSAIRDNDSRWYSDLFDPRTFLDMPLHVLLHFDTCVGLTYWFALLEVSHLSDHCCATFPSHGTDSHYLPCSVVPQPCWYQCSYRIDVICTISCIDSS